MTILLRTQRARGYSLRLIVALVTALIGVLTTSSSASAAVEAPHWKVESRTAPTSLPTKGEGEIIAVAANIGNADVNGFAHPVKFVDQLPEKVKVTSIEPAVVGTTFSSGKTLSCSQSGQKIECTYADLLPPFEQLEITIRVKTEFTGPAEPENEVTASGGGETTPEAKLRRKLKINDKATAFGVETFEVTPENENFEEEHRAGAHPYQLTTTLAFNQTLAHDPGDPKLTPHVPQLIRNLSVKLPPGLVGNVNVSGKDGLPQQCPDISFGSNSTEGTNTCPANTAIGAAAVTFNDGVTITYVTFLAPVFNLVPAPGEPARFGIDFQHVPIVLDTFVRTGEEYGVTVSVHDASQAVQVLSTRVTIWGTPNDESHKSARGWQCMGKGSRLKGEPCEPLLSKEGPQPFLLLPTSCESPLKTRLVAESWAGGPPFTGGFESPEPLKGCNELEFKPSISLSPDQHSASTPTGMNVGVELPQKTTLEPGGRSEADVRSTTLALPRGLQANAGAANQLLACSAGAMGFNVSGNGGFVEGLPESQQLENNDFSSTIPDPSPGLPEPPCPQGSKLGTVDIHTPLLHEDVVGGVYLAEQNTNPFAPPLVLYIVAKEPTSKTLVKLAGEVTVCPEVKGACEEVGQLVSTFKNTPQVPFETLKLHLFNGPNNHGERAAQATPAHCGEYQAKASFENWSTPGTTEANSKGEEFNVTSGPHGTPCPGATLPFTPKLAAGPENTQAGAFTTFSLKLLREDGNQALTGLEVKLPPGAAAKLASRTPCPVAVADVGGCGAASLMGHAQVSSGLGNAPYTLAGEAFLTESFKPGAPFGVSVLTGANAVGPFNIGTIIANSAITVDPNTAAATITAFETRVLEATGATTIWPGPGRPSVLPTEVKNVPVQLHQIVVNVDQPGFEFNPTNCSGKSITGLPMATTAALSGAEGGSASASSNYGVTGCANIAFTPKLTASVVGPGSKENGTQFAVKVESTSGQANIAKTFLALPIALPSRLSTIQKACLAATFEANPASCPEGSNIGFAVAHTPVLKSPVTGPAYLVSHGNAAFPDVEFVLQGEGITLVLDGKTDIKKGITYSRFETVPDAPVETFETVLPAGPHSALTANVPESEHFNLCKHGSELVIPTEITGQNGALLTQQTKIELLGCPKGGVASFCETHKTMAKCKLEAALRACRKKFKGSSKSRKKKRASCEAAARKKYGPKKHKAAKHKH